MGTGQNRTHMIYVRPNEQQIYTANVSSSSVTFIEHVKGWNETIIPVGKGDEGFQSVRPNLQPLQ